ncbi:hypothetical protein IMSAG049_00408 [Clostridiales bacterium]|nr:hypothetical protein IMSAG049_00408 [Clostridiales bacterium]
MKYAKRDKRLKQANMILRKYKSGKTALEQKIIENEQWWKLRHWRYIKGGNPYDMKPASAWLFNVIINKHADGVEAFPEPNILPREINDKEEASRLSSIIPAVLEQNDFEETYSDVLWQKLKTGTGVYGIFWDSSKLNGLGDIAIRKVDMLNLFWEPGITDLQRSRNVFCTELMDNDVLEEMYPQLKGKLVGNSMTLAKYIYDDNVDTSGKSVVIDWYYKKYVSGKEVLHYCKYVDTTVIYATENDMERRITGEEKTGNPIYGESRAERGWYDHGKYPFVFDRLFPAEGTPCGFGYIDVCKNTQEQIDRLNQAIMKNAVMAATPRFFMRGDGSINEKEFTDWTKPIVHVNGNLGADSIRSIDVPNLGEIYMAVLSSKISELRETSGNNEASTGNTPSGVTAASAIAALQEAAGKTSRASTLSAYRAYSRVISQVIELIRQFYDLPRQFRITGAIGEDSFVSYSNAQLKPQQEYDGFLRSPVFDIKVSAQRKTSYSKVQQNELALQLYQSGCFNPELAEQAMLLLETMDFDGKERIMRKIIDNSDIARLTQGYRELAIAMAKEYDPEVYERIMTMGGETKTSGIKKGASKKIRQGESAITLKARKRASAAAMPK